MTYIPKGAKRHWTAEEESILAESWGACGIPALAKKLNRSQQAIKMRASRLHLGPLLMGGDYVTLNQLVTTFNRAGSYSYKMISWVENRGLPVHNKRVQQNTFRVVYLKEFWTWAVKPWMSARSAWSPSAKRSVNCKMPPRVRNACRDRAGGRQ